MKSGVRLSLLNASDGPRVMLFGPMDADIEALQQCFRSLSRGCETLRLEEQPFIKPVGGIHLAAKCSGSAISDKDCGKQQGIFMLSKSPPSFEWIRTAEGWDYLAELIDGLVKSDMPSHQYLTRYPDEDAIVVVSKGEYSDQVLVQ